MDDGGFNCCCMALFNCVVGSDSRTADLASRPGGWRLATVVIQRFEAIPDAEKPVAGEWAAMLMQHVAKSNHFVALYGGMAQVVSTDGMAHGELCKVSLLKFAWGVIQEALEVIVRMKRLLLEAQ